VNIDRTSETTTAQCLTIFNLMIEDVQVKKNIIADQIHVIEESLFDLESSIISTRNSERDTQLFSPRNDHLSEKKFIEKTQIEKKLLEERKNQLEIEFRECENRFEQIEFLKCNYHAKSPDDLTDEDIASIYESQNSERHRIVRDLHDCTIQDLTYLIYKIEFSIKHLDQDTNYVRLEMHDMIKKIKSIINDMRDIIFNIRPMEIDDLGIEGALMQFIDTLRNSSDISIEYDIKDLDLFDTNKMLFLYQIIKEFCNNAIKHANADLLKLDIKKVDDNLFVIIEDNGLGYDIKSISKTGKHFGLQIAKERIKLLKGEIEINTGASKGTKIIISVPVA